MRSLLLLFFIIGLSMSFTLAQDSFVTSTEIYRLIVDSSKKSAGEVYWAEIHQREDGIALEWAMNEVQRVGLDLEATCYRALFVGEGSPIYTVNNELIPIETARQLRDSFAGRGLMLNSEQFVTQGVECVNEPMTDHINGYEAALCSFDNIDTLALFRTKGNAVAHGEMWTAIQGGYPVKYEFVAEGTEEGSNNMVKHIYELLASRDIQITYPTGSDLQCFPDSFPQLPQTYIVMSNLNYLVAVSDLLPEELRLELDLALISSGWEIDTDSSYNSEWFYYRDLLEGNSCRVRVHVRDGNGQTQLGVSVSPKVDIANVSLPDGWESPIVVQNANFRNHFKGTVEEAAQDYISLERSFGWSIREELTDIRSDSAFIVLTNDSQEQYVTIDSVRGGADLSVQYADVCSIGG